MCTQQVKVKHSYIAKFYGLPITTKDDTKRESDLSYFHWVPIKVPSFENIKPFATVYCASIRLKWVGNVTDSLDMTLLMTVT